MYHVSPNQPVPTMLRKFYECGICGAYHSVEWDGDCRQDNARFMPEELDEKYGMTGWETVPMPGGEEE